MNGSHRDGTAGLPDGQAETWQAALRRYFASLTTDEADRLRAGAVQGLDLATRARQLQIREIARLSALADYLVPRIEKREGTERPTLAEGVLMGLMAGYQLAVGEATPQEPDPFAD
jgi:hypothetical protein